MVALFPFRERDRSHKSANSRQTRDIFDPLSGFYPAGKRQFFAPKSHLAAPLDVVFQEIVHK